jgi:hypothetical protein
VARGAFLTGAAAVEAALAAGRGAAFATLAAGVVFTAGLGAAATGGLGAAGSAAAFFVGELAAAGFFGVLDIAAPGHACNIYKHLREPSTCATLPTSTTQTFAENHVATTNTPNSHSTTHHDALPPRSAGCKTPRPSGTAQTDTPDQPRHAMRARGSGLQQRTCQCEHNQHTALPILLLELEENALRGRIAPRHLG